MVFCCAWFYKNNRVGVLQGSRVKIPRSAAIVMLPQSLQLSQITGPARRAECYEHGRMLGVDACEGVGAVWPHPRDAVFCVSPFVHSRIPVCACMADSLRLYPDERREET